MSNTTKSPAQRITRSAAIKLLSGLTPSDIAGVTFVARGDERTGGPYLCTLSFKRGVRKHLKGGQRNYDAAEHGLMGVFEVINLTTALKRYRDQAQGDIDYVLPQIEPAQQALAEAEVKLSNKETKKNKESVRVLTSKLEALRAKLNLARLKQTDHIAALKQEIQQRISNREEEIAELEQQIAAASGDTAELQEKLEETQHRLAREQEYLAEPEQSLLIRYRNINLTGLVELTIAGKVYKVTTPPVPAIPVNKEN